jgi:two-component system, NarL family, response regulator YdfI
VSRVVVAGSPLLRAGIATLAEVIGSAPGIEEAAALAAELRPDVFLAECEERVARELIAAARASPPILALSIEAEPNWIAEALAAGIRGVIPRDAHESEIAAGIEAVASGLVVLHPEWADAAITRRATLARTQADPLSPREVEVLKLMGEGASNKAIAWQLQISEHTVKFHVNSILEKMGAGSRTEAVMLGVRRGLIPL